MALKFRRSRSGRKRSSSSWSRSLPGWWVRAWISRHSWRSRAPTPTGSKVWIRRNTPRTRSSGTPSRAAASSTVRSCRKPSSFRFPTRKAPISRSASRRSESCSCHSRWSVRLPLRLTVASTEGYSSLETRTWGPLLKRP